MKQLLLLLIATFAFPMALNAESIWLVLYMGKSGLEKIEMRDLDQCKQKGEAYKAMEAAGLFKNYICIEGK